MSTLKEYLLQKRDAIVARRTRAQSGDTGPVLLQAQARAEGRSGVRRIRIRDFQIISDSPPDFAGYDLGPSSPELLLGSLSSCLTHTYLIQAADLGIEIEDLSVEVNGQIDPRAGTAGFEDVPIYPHDIAYTVTITTPSERVEELHAAVERNCPILNLLKNPAAINGRIIRKDPSTIRSAAA